MAKNFQALHRFVDGMQTDYDNHIDGDKSYEYGLNGRLYSHNGVISFSSLKGTKKVYENENIVKYLGFCAFNDELILFLKGLPTIATGDNGTIIYNPIKQIIAKSFVVTIPFGSDSTIVDIDPNISEVEYLVPEFIPAEDELNFSIDVSCVDEINTVIDWSEYFSEDLDVENLQICQVNTELNNYENNVDFIDVIVSLKKDNLGVIHEKIMWAGFQNWPMNGKILTQGVDENSFYKRVYYTDFQNIFRVVNLKDNKLATRTSDEFNTFQNVALLQPKVIAINELGQIKASTVFYTYRLYTENGQVSAFAPFSEPIKILFDDEGFDYGGGDISQVTNKSVQIKVNLPQFQRFSEIEVVAVEYEAKDAPTAIRSLGIKPIASVVVFDHFGSEPEFSSSITLSDLTARQNNWKYCSDLLSTRNKLVTAGLRNEPIPNSLSRITEEFALHSWDENAETFNCLLNPMPWKYRFIDPSVTEDLFYIKQKVYNSIQVFGTFTVFLKNTETNESMSVNIPTSQLTYVDQTINIWNWLDSINETVEFTTKFPNLTIELVQNKILFKPTNVSIETDMADYIFNYSVTQVIEDEEKDIVFTNVIVNPANFIYGGVSLGFNKGNGIRITFRTEMEEVMSINETIGQDNLLNYTEPNQKKCFFKGEIYRPGLQFYDQEGNELFVIPLGDMMIPKYGEAKKYIDDNGNIIIETDTYKNSKTIGDKLYAEKTVMKVEVRLSCEVQRVVSMYQLVYVERTEENRTILAQGLSGPMQRTQTFFHDEFIQLLPAVDNKWNLPYYGGPIYDRNGLRAYDMFGENILDGGYESALTRVVTHRKLFYFDAPDIIHSLVSGERVATGSVSRIARLNTDHSPKGFIPTFFIPMNDSFSRKVFSIDFDVEYRPYFVNVSVFSQERPGEEELMAIKYAEPLEKGQLMAGFKFDTSFDVSNAAMTLAHQDWYYSDFARRSMKCSLESGAKSELFNSNNISLGRSTVVIKTEEEMFSDDFIDMAPITVVPQVHNGDVAKVFDTHALVNIDMGNRESVYGGRGELAYSKNIYIPLSETIPVLKTSNGSQNFIVHGDTYSSLFIRVKNHLTGFRPGFKDMNNNSGCNNSKEEEDFARAGAWCYAFVCESMVEVKFTHNEAPWRNESPFNFSDISENINEAYFQQTSPKSYISRPFRFKDDPNMLNMIAVSDVKLNGSFFDGWTNFRVNNFYEIDKDKGAVYNLAKWLDNVYAIQENQTSLLNIDPRTMIQTDDGQGVSIKQGDGNSITDHQVVSDFGTSIRRAVVDIVSSSDKIKGFSFFDERKIEFVRINTPLFIERKLHLSMFRKFKDDPIVDTEGYYDDEYKETNIRIRTMSGVAYMLSFNEVFQVFNGWIEYDNDLYAVWNQEVYAPITTEVPYLDGVRPDSSKLHQLNIGTHLNFFGEQKTIKLGIVCNIEEQKVKIYPHWEGAISTNYPIKKLELKTSLGHLRTILGSHHRYRIREELHSVPLKNRTDWDDLRGTWMYLEVEIESIDDTKVDIFSFINFVRDSYL